MKDDMEKKVPYKCSCGHRVTKVLYADEEHARIYFINKKGVAIQNCPKCYKKLKA
jgi:hypothetical protein